MEDGALFGKKVYLNVDIPPQELAQIDGSVSPDQAEAIFMPIFGLLLTEAWEFINENFGDASNYYEYFIGNIISAMEDPTGRFNFHFLPYGASLEYERRRLESLEGNINAIPRERKSEVYLAQPEPEIQYVDIVPHKSRFQAGSDHTLHIYIPQELFAEAFGSFSGSICALCEIMELGMSVYHAYSPSQEIGAINHNTIRYFQGSSMEAGETLVARFLVECADIYGMDLSEFLNNYLFTYCQANPTVLALLDPYIHPGILGPSIVDPRNIGLTGTSFN